MGFMANKWAETDALLKAAIAPNLGGEQLVGCVHAIRQGKMSAKVFAIGITPEHLVIVEVDRKMRPGNDAPTKLKASEITVGNLFGEGAGWSIGQKDQEIRFTARGEKHRYMVMGGNMVENALTGAEQVSGLNAFVEFLRGAPS